jgi:hypothetical protein
MCADAALQRINTHAVYYLRNTSSPFQPLASAQSHTRHIVRQTGQAHVLRWRSAERLCRACDRASSGRKELMRMWTGGMVAQWLALLGLAQVAAASSATPRVALLFASRGDMPLETVWRTFFSSVKGLRLPDLSQEQWQDVMEVQRVADVTEKLKDAGSFTATDTVSKSWCTDNNMIKVRIPIAHSRLVQYTTAWACCSYIVRLCTPSEPDVRQITVLDLLVAGVGLSRTRGTLVCACREQQRSWQHHGGPHRPEARSLGEERS